MQTANLLTREDTFLGICQGAGEDLRIPPNLIRLTFAGSLFFNPVATLGAYLSLGVVVAFTRWLFPANRSPVQAPIADTASAATPVAQNDQDAEQRLAA